jgi:hypothetical protein
MFAVSFENKGMFLLPNEEQVKTEPTVDERSQEGQPRTHAEVFQLQPCDPLFDGYINDIESGNDDHGSFESCREETDLVVTVMVGTVGWFDAEPQAVCGEGYRYDMNDGFRGIGEDSGSPCQPVGKGFGRQHKEADGQ